MFSFSNFIQEEFLVEERTVQPVDEEHALVHVWNHFVGNGLIKHGEDNTEVISRELENAQNDENHPLNFKNARKIQGLVRKTKTTPKAVRNSYNRALNNATSTINTWAQHPMMEKPIKDRHVARVVGKEKGEVTETWHKHGANKGATKTSKADIIIRSKDAGETEQGINLSLKQAGGSMLAGAAINENKALHDHAAREMLNAHYSRLPKDKREEIHAEVMAHATSIGVIQRKLKEAKNAEQQKKLKARGDRMIREFHEKYPKLNYFLRKEAATGMGKFGGSGHSAHFFATTKTEKGEATINHHTDAEMEEIYNAPDLPRIAYATAGRISSRTGELAPTRDARIFYDNKPKRKKKTLNEMLLERKSTQEKIMAAAERAAAVFSTSQKSKQRDKARFASDTEARQESEQRKAKTANREVMSARKEARAQQSDTDLRWTDYDNKVMRGVTGRGAVSHFAKGANLDAPNQFKLEEEVPANAMGTAGISGLDNAVNVGIAGRDMLLTPEPLRRPPPKMFGGKRVFTVPSKDYYKATLGRKKGQHWRSMVNGPLGEEIRQYALDNKDAPIIVEDETTGAMMYLRYGKR